jgi:hypothetical protein
MKYLHGLDRMLQHDVLLIDLVFSKRNIQVDNLLVEIEKNNKHPFRIVTAFSKYQYSQEKPKIIYSIPDKNTSYLLYSKIQQAILLFIDRNRVRVLFNHGFIDGLTLIENLYAQLLGVKTFQSQKKLTLESYVVLSELEYLRRKAILKRQSFQFAQLDNVKRLEFSTSRSVSTRDMLRLVISCMCSVFNRKKIIVQMVLPVKKDNVFNQLSVSDQVVKKGNTIALTKSDYICAAAYSYMTRYLDLLGLVSNGKPKQEPYLTVSICNIRKESESIGVESFSLDSKLKGREMKLATCTVLQTHKKTFYSLTVNNMKLFLSLKTILGIS